MEFMSKESIFYTLAATVLVLLLAPTAQTESAQKLKSDEEAVREEMLRITRELGTTCTECHKTSDFTNGEKKSFRIGAKHMKLVTAMKAAGFDGKDGPEANCFMCHRGELRPPAKAAEKTGHEK